jgi:hypothetical protein
MTRRDFELIAGALRNAGSLGVTRHVAEALADALATSNARFDRERFLEACKPGGGHRVT